MKLIKQQYMKRQQQDQQAIERVGLRVQHSLKVTSIVYVHGKIPNNRKSSNLQVQPYGKLFYHCYRRFKTFTYTFDQVYDDTQSSSIFENSNSDSQSFNQFAISKTLDNGINYMLYCSGFCLQNSKTISIFNQLLAKVISPQNKGNKLNLYALAISQDFIVDLNSQKTIKQIRQSSQKYHLLFPGAESLLIETEYQLKIALFETFQKKNKILLNSYYVVYIQIQIEQRNQTILLIDAVKATHEKTHWDSNSQLVLNKCIAGLISKTQKALDKKSDYSPFRDSKLTRTMKPFLVQNCKVDLITFVDRNDEEVTYQHLNWLKNFSRIKINVKKIDQRHKSLSIKLLSLQKQNQDLKSRLESQDAMSKSQVRKNYFDELKQLDQSQNNLKNQCSRNEALIKILRYRVFNKKLYSLPHQSFNNASKQENLEEKQIQHKQTQQKQIQMKIQAINAQRINTINSVDTTTEKLQLMKEYYMRNLEYHEEEVQRTLEYQKQVEKVYKSSIRQIDQFLKKSPKQLISNNVSSLITSHITPQKSRSISKKSIKKEINKHKFITEQSKKSQGSIFAKNSTSGIRKKTLVNPEHQESMLPYLSYKQREDKRKKIIKQKAEKGRVQYESYLQKNIKLYQSYAANKK